MLRIKTPAGLIEPLPVKKNNKTGTGNLRQPDKAAGDLKREPFPEMYRAARLSRQDELFQMSNWTGRPKVRKHGGMAQSVVRSGSLYRPKAWWHAVFQ